MLLNIDNRLTQLEVNVKDISKPEPKVNIENDVANGLIKGLSRLREDDESHLKLIEMTRRMQNQPTAIMNQSSAGNDPFFAGGNLVPANLTEEEKQVLKEFYA